MSPILSWPPLVTKSPRYSGMLQCQNSAMPEAEQSIPRLISPSHSGWSRGPSRGIIQQVAAGCEGHHTEPHTSSLPAGGREANGRGSAGEAVKDRIMFILQWSDGSSFWVAHSVIGKSDWSCRSSPNENAHQFWAKSDEHFVCKMCGNYSIENNGVECDQNLISPVEVRNEFAHQIWAKSN